VALESNMTPTSNDDKSLVYVLNGLIHVCREGYAGYMRAAEGITSSAYRTMFAEYAHQRNRFASQLANFVVEYGGDPEDDGTSMKMFPHGWVGIEPAVMGGDYGAIFAECENSDVAAKTAYERVLEMTLPKAVATVINQQYKQIIEVHDRIHNLREAYHVKHKKSL
jgi:uncharacterized protein (TIGR02284 family)